MYKDRNLSSRAGGPIWATAIWFTPVTAIACLLLGATCWGAEIAPPQSTPQPPPSAISTVPGKAGAYDVDASGTDVKFVLEALARQSGANIVVSPDIAGQLNMHVKGQSLESILDSLSATMDVAWKKDGTTYLVVPKSRLAPPVSEKPVSDPAPESTIAVCPCHNIDPREVVGIIMKLFPGVNAVVGPSISLPSYTDDAGSSGGSSANPGVYQYPGEGSDPSSASASAASATPATAGLGNRGDKIILMGPVGDVEKAKLVLGQLDVRKRQVNIELAITEIKTSGDKQVGVDWNWDPISVKEGFTTPNSDPTDTGSAFNPTNVVVAQPKFLTQPWNFGATLSAMVKNGSANLLAKPNISVLDGGSGRIFLGDTVRYLELDSRDRDGKPIYRSATVDAGISLPIAARILNDDSIMLTLHPAVSLITGYSIIEGSQYPQVSTREVQTTVIIKNGAMLAIGGLIRDEDTKNASKVPIMGDLPVIGALFRSTTTKKQRTELIILLCPKIMEEK